MGDLLEFRKRLSNVSGGNRNLLETSHSPTRNCLSTSAMVTFVEDGKIDPNLFNHLENCPFCRERRTNYKAISGLSQ